MEMTTVKTAAVFLIIFGCFAVLYPKIFHPMLMQVVGLGTQEKSSEDLINNRMSPHLRKPGQGVPVSEDISKHMRAGPHPGMRAAAEMKKQAAPQGTGAGKGMMSIVLPMYAVGIVLYLLYTMTKVFGGKGSPEKSDFLNSHFTDIRYDPDKQKFTSTQPDEKDDEALLSRRFKKGRQDLERLLLKADKNNISSNELHDLKQRLLETEAQMTRILSAMETVQKQTEQVVKETERGTGDGEEEDGDWVDDKEEEEDIQPELKPGRSQSAGSSPDVDTYEFIKRQSSDDQRSPSIEELCADISKVTDDLIAGESCDLQDLDDDLQEGSDQEDPEEVIMDDKEESADIRYRELRKRLPREPADAPED